MFGTPTEPRPESDLRRIANGVAHRYVWEPDGVEKGVGAWEYRGLPKTWKADVPPLLYETDEVHEFEWQRDGDTRLIYSSYSGGYIADTPTWRCVPIGYVPPKDMDDKFARMSIGELMQLQMQPMQPNRLTGWN